MTISRYCSKVTMPAAEKPYPSILDFLTRRFPRVLHTVWQQRIQEGKVLDDDGNPITADTEYKPLKRIFYFREVKQERVIPFTEGIIFQNDDLVVACKPHFLPVTPSGPYVTECLLNRLRKSTGNHDLVPIHRIDRETAGIVMFSANRKTRSLYNEIFVNGKVEKLYHAVSKCNHDPETTEWSIENRIVTGEPWFIMKIEPGDSNSRSIIRLVERKGDLARFHLVPLTGKTHQLRLHMSSLGFKILNDRYYPELTPETDDDFSSPLQLIAKKVRFTDPVTGTPMEFTSERELQWCPL
ncbi:pseudouridine synthase [Pelotalea chapellei]|uniref:Pseudouridine synthase n=1 Tax=Pelotalea chapellei TaxID=44671 RepID=A0ABS5U5Z3_9BACT|nr:pseudouridine synthase [Pelotalea chapellei]MBT1071092.1 pseudouridine synthase [Pelotalea chapellei]